jgi:hypothetical protein
MKVDKSQWERKRLKISSLKPHPDQDELYGGTTTLAQDQAFARDLMDRGQLDAVHVMPFPNAAGLEQCTVLDGWRRVTGSKANGETGVDCYIRHDLADATAAEVAVAFAKFNPNRRQLSRLALARNISYQIKAQRGHPGELGWRDREKLKKQVGEQLGLDVRTINRYLLVLEAPIEVQRAYDRGEVTLVDAGKVALLSKQQQRQIPEQIAAGGDAKEVVRKHIQNNNGRHRKATDGFARFVADLERALADIGDRPHEVYRGAIKEKASVLKQSKALITTLITESRKPFFTEDEMREEFGNWARRLEGRKTRKRA